ncbi:hypothetical protein [Amycolatopsis sp. WGS_07]|uniref:hypothetical protein n=1 Tax=Amycolatopsis sp. WGS_07 TaxID=3076764 RepID=UPI00387367D0
MSEGRWFDAWVPWPELSGLAAAGRALLPAVPATPAALARTVTEQLVGRRLTTTVQGHEVGLTLTELDYPADSLRLATGRVGDVRIVAEDVDWPVPNASAAPVAHGAGRLAGTAGPPRRGAAAGVPNARGGTKEPTTADAFDTSGGKSTPPSADALSQADGPHDTSPLAPDCTEQSGGDRTGARPTGPRESTAWSDSGQVQDDRRIAEAVPGAAARNATEESDATCAGPSESEQPTSRSGSGRQSTGREAGSAAQSAVEMPARPAVDRIPLRRVTVLASDVRLRGLPSPAVIPGSVELEIEVSGTVVRDRVAAARPDLIATPHAEGFRVRWRKHPHWGHLTLVAGIEDDAVVLTPAALHIGRWTRHPPKRIRPIVLPLPDLPKGLRLTGIRPGEDELALTIAADEWPGRLARIPLPDLLSWLTTAAMTLTLPGFGSRSLPEPAAAPTGPPLGPINGCRAAEIQSARTTVLNHHPIRERSKTVGAQGKREKRPKSCRRGRLTSEPSRQSAPRGYTDDSRRRSSPKNPVLCRVFAGKRAFRATLVPPPEGTPRTECRPAPTSL